MEASSPLGDRIRKRRQALGLTQDELAKAVKVNVSSVISWESGEHRPIRKLGAIERVLGRLDEEPGASSSAEESVQVMLRELAKLQEELRNQRPGKAGEDDARFAV